MSILSHLEDADIIKKRNREANEYRVGILGPPLSGKSSIVAKLHRIKGSPCGKSLSDDDGGGGSGCASHLNKVMCVPVCRGQSLGIKIVPSKSHPMWCCVHSYLPEDISSQRSAVQADGRVKVGDLLIAIGDTSLMHKSPFDIVSILKAADHNIDNHLLITFLRAGVNGSTEGTDGGSIDNHSCHSLHDSSSNCNNYSCHSSDLDSSTSTTQPKDEVYIDHPKVMISSSYFCYTKKPSKPSSRQDVTSYHMMTQCSHHKTTSVRPKGSNDVNHPRPSLVEVIDLPGNDPQHKILREWIPRLDAMILVYSATSTSSLLSLENTYLRLIAKLSVREPFELPLVVVCNKADADPSIEAMNGNSSDFATRVVELKAKRDTLVMEGRSLAEAWNAPFYVISCREEPESMPNVSTPVQQNSCRYDGFEQIFESAIGQFLLRDGALHMHDNSGCAGGLSTQLTDNNTPSILNFLPFLGQCLTLTDDASGGQPLGSASARKLQSIEFSPARLQARRKDEYDHEVESVVSVTDCDSDSSSSVEDYYLTSDGNTFMDSGFRPFRKTAIDRAQLNVKKKIGGTHDIWKVIFTGNGSTSLVCDDSNDELDSSALSGDQIVGME